jgi:outer membrane protein OmpA-like peptidoglycan-associated protein
MRLLPVTVLAALALTGCAHTGVSLFDGEKHPDGTQNPTGALAVLDPVTGQDVSIIDQADASRNVRKNKVSVRNMTPEQLNARYGSLLSSLPAPPTVLTLYFKEGSTELVDPSLLEVLLSEVKRRPGVDVQIVGHTDTVGDGDANDSLSIQRAEAVKTLLSGIGLPGEVIRATGRGERDPMVATADNVDEPQNRRVEVYIK